MSTNINTKLIRVDESDVKKMRLLVPKLLIKIEPSLSGMQMSNRFLFKRILEHALK